MIFWIRWSRWSRWSALQQKVVVVSECPPCVFGLVGDYIYPGCEYECKLFLDVLTTCSATLYISYMLCVFLYYFFWCILQVRFRPSHGVMVLIEDRS